MRKEEMKRVRWFWVIFVTSIIMVVGGYLILMILNPDQMHESEYIPAAVCILVIPVGGAMLLVLLC